VSQFNQTGGDILPVRDQVWLRARGTICRQLSDAQEPTRDAGRDLAAFKQAKEMRHIALT